ncbi:hypothetical protein GCM10023320_57900 [Pseudonocardia adelaidensis]|uniref:Uncharacterized protein n=1 Tax=Pseudonocardia adelaidensis TaxID=648754 RepID=A0ABP9NRY6_9PSEU
MLSGLVREKRVGPAVVAARSSLAQTSNRERPHGDGDLVQCRGDPAASNSSPAECAVLSPERENYLRTADRAQIGFPRRARLYV